MSQTETQLRLLLAEALSELRTIEAITVSPSDIDGLMNLCNRIAEALGQPAPFRGSL